MQVTGDGAVDLTYRINGGAEQTEQGVILPWEKSYSVYPELETSVTVESGARTVGCTITMGEHLVAFENEPSPTCGFAYWG
ncbi:hypothetical protein VZC37_07830 [Gordonia sp. LSe1-13]|uniref:Uncharacterized protein n=1 Tax=Gordonia sesuvii TaxID=3116777 RepID=A0ABU7MAV9_9ACTN|nr:hypothetical protein [Gordonia sp. LSe1-13]